MPLAGVELDLRKAKRYPMSATVSFCWIPGDGVLQEGQGITADISSRGVFVITDLALRAGDHLELDVYLQAPGAESRSVHFHGEGRVVRTTKKGGESGFAAEVLFQTEGPESPFSEYGGTIQ